jgi:hypothetical protein
MVLVVVIWYKKKKSFKIAPVRRNWIKKVVWWYIWLNKNHLKDISNRLKKTFMKKELVYLYIVNIADSFKTMYVFLARIEHGIK